MKKGDMVRIKPDAKERMERHGLTMYKIPKNLVAQIHSFVESTNACMIYTKKYGILYFKLDCVEPYDLEREQMLELENEL